MISVDFSHGYELIMKAPYTMVNANGTVLALTNCAKDLRMRKLLSAGDLRTKYSKQISGRTTEIWHSDRMTTAQRSRSEVRGC